MLHHLAVYLLQQPTCKVIWDELKLYHQEMSRLSNLVEKLGLSADAPKPCFVHQTLSNMYKVSMTENNLRPFYSNHYDRAVEHLRESVIDYYKSPGAYIRTFHQFTHLTLIAFYEYALPSEGGLHDGYANLTNRTIFTNTLPNGVNTWKELGAMRNRVDHPVDKNTKTYSKKITAGEVEFFCKKLQVALQEIFNVWLCLSPPATPVNSLSTTPIAGSTP